MEADFWWHIWLWICVLGFIVLTITMFFEFASRQFRKMNGYRRRLSDADHSFDIIAQKYILSMFQNWMLMTSLRVQIDNYILEKEIGSGKYIEMKQNLKKNYDAHVLDLKKFLNHEIYVKEFEDMILLGDDIDMLSASVEDAIHNEAQDERLQLRTDLNNAHNKMLIYMTSLEGRILGRIDGLNQGKEKYTGKKS